MAALPSSPNGLDADELQRTARAVAQVDRAVRHYRAGYRPVHVSLAVAAALKWPLCGCGAGGIRPGACVSYRGLLWHAGCALERAQEDVAA